MRTTIKLDPNKIKLARLKKGFSIRKLEKVSKVTRATIIRLEKGIGTAEEYTAFKLAKALKVNMEDLQ